MEFSTVDLVEELHHDKDGEQDGEVPAGGGVPPVLRHAVGGRPEGVHGTRGLVEGVALGVVLAIGGDARLVVRVVLRVVSVRPPRAHGARGVVVELAEGRAEVVVGGGGGADVAEREDHQEEHKHLPARVADELPDHAVRQQGLVAGVGGAEEEVREGVLGGECDRRKRVHDHVDPEQLDDVEGRLCEDGGSDDGEEACG
mmetsp:Transcript_24041/g.60383  ORF Transcript_24041/g.60383 Transcript_24041/m.60383 type:complete len:200 (-) Transcript_24041:34-633(-)